MAIRPDGNVNGASDGGIRTLYDYLNSTGSKILHGFLKLFFIIPTILFVVTVILSVNSSMILKTYHKCTGTIVGFCETTAPGNMDSDANKTISPVVSYTVDGEDYEFIGNYYSTSMKVGQEITALYHNEDPSNAIIKSGLYVAPAVLGALTLFFTLFYVALIILRRKGCILF